jgi:hypothetical protein
MATQLSKPVVIANTEEFQLGIREGRGNSQKQARFNLDGCVTESGIVEIVMNLCEMYYDDELSDEQLQHDCGLIVGWVMRASRESRA